MTRTLTLAVATAALLGFAGSAYAEGNCGGYHSAQQSVPVETAQTDQTAPQQTPKPAENDS